MVYDFYSFLIVYDRFLFSRFDQLHNAKVYFRVFAFSRFLGVEFIILVHEIKYFSLFMDNLKIWWTIAKFLKDNFTYIPEDPAFSTGGRPIFKCKYICVGSNYSRNQNRFRIYNLSSIKSNLTLGYQKSE
jgi:hypothetical protein